MWGFELGRVALRGRCAAHEAGGVAFLRVFFASLLALTLGACAELRPQMFSDRLSEPVKPQTTRSGGAPKTPTVVAPAAPAGGTSTTPAGASSPASVSISVADAKKDIESVQ